MLVQPHFDYCSVVWRICGKILSDKLQKLKNRAARVLTYSTYDTNVERLFQLVGWNSFNIRSVKDRVLLWSSSLCMVWFQNI